MLGYTPKGAVIALLNVAAGAAFMLMLYLMIASEHEVRAENDAIIRTHEAQFTKNRMSYTVHRYKFVDGLDCVSIGASVSCNWEELNQRK